MSASRLKLKSSHFRNCCEENFYLCVRLTQSCMEIFSIAAKLFVWRLRIRVQKAQSPHYWQMGGKNLKSVNNCKYSIWELYWILSSQMTETFSRDNCDINIVQQTSCKPLFPDVQMQLKMYFFVPFVRPCMHHIYGGIAESRACRDCVWPIILDAELYTTCPGERVLVVMTHQVQCNIPTFEALLRKNRYLFLERCRRSNNVWLSALTQSDCLYSSLFFGHYNRILLCEWVLEHCSVCSFEGAHVTMHSYFIWPWPV